MRSIRTVERPATTSAAGRWRRRGGHRRRGVQVTSFLVGVLSRGARTMRPSGRNGSPTPARSPQVRDGVHLQFRARADLARFQYRRRCSGRPVPARSASSDSVVAGSLGARGGLPAAAAADAADHSGGRHVITFTELTTSIMCVGGRHRCHASSMAHVQTPTTHATFTLSHGGQLRRTLLASTAVITTPTRSPPSATSRPRSRSPSTCRHVLARPDRSRCPLTPFGHRRDGHIEAPFAELTTTDRR